jgi:molybdenum cofactor cytidylyltransferase
VLEGGNKQFAVAVVILAAGASRRMGEPKLLLPWGKTSVLGHLLQQWKALEASQIAIVCAAAAQPMLEEMDRLGLPETSRIFNATPEEGMFGSIQCAANWRGWNAGLTHWVVTLGDQPHLNMATLRKLLEFGARNPDKICQPMRGERRKHPVLLPGHLFAELKASSSGDLKMFLVEHAKELYGFESDDAGLDFDMDTREDYEKLQRTYW